MTHLQLGNRGRLQLQGQQRERLGLARPARPQRRNAITTTPRACSLRSQPAPGGREYGAAAPQRGATVVCSSSSSSSSSSVGTWQRRRSLADVIDWTINLPWQKMFAWAVVLGGASQLSDFFGVSGGRTGVVRAVTPTVAGRGRTAAAAAAAAGRGAWPGLSLTPGARPCRRCLCRRLRWARLWCRSSATAL